MKKLIVSLTALSFLAIGAPAFAADAAKKEEKKAEPAKAAEPKKEEKKAEPAKAAEPKKEEKAAPAKK